MTQAVAFERPLAAAPVPQVGPVLLAMKPARGSPAALAVARWLAAREDRALDMVTVLEQHEAARRVVDAAAACSARVIVIGAGGHSMPERHDLGESALQILSLADRPVLIVPSDAVAGPVSVAVVAVDFSPASVRAARAVFPMLSEHSRLRLVHVRARDRQALGVGVEPHETYDERCAELFKQFQHQLPSLPGVSVDVTSLSGDPTASLVAFAADCHAGLIACGRLAHSFAERLFARSVSSELVRRAGCPVLVVPEQSGDLRLC